MGVEGRGNEDGGRVRESEREKEREGAFRERDEEGKIRVRGMRTERKREKGVHR